MRNRWHKICLLAVGLVVSVDCVCTDSLLTGPLPTVTPSPLQGGSARAAVSRATTDTEGRAVVFDSQGLEQAMVQVSDEESRLPLQGVEVYLLLDASSYSAVAGRSRGTGAADPDRCSRLAITYGLVRWDI